MNRWGVPATKVRWRPRDYKAPQARAPALPPVQPFLDPGRYVHARHQVLKCGVCDYVLEISSMSSDKKAYRMRYCPNCTQLKGLPVVLERSLK